MVNHVWVVTYEAVHGDGIVSTFGVYASYELAAEAVIQAANVQAICYREYNDSETKIDVDTRDGQGVFTVLEKWGSDEQFQVQDVYEIVRHEVNE